MVRESLEKEGWNITNDPLRLNAPREKRLQADLGGTKLIGAMQNKHKIAVEIKGFRRPSLLYEFHAALGQYLVYEDAIERRNLDWIMHLAMPEAAYRVLEKEEHILYSLRKREVKLILFDATLKIITEWIN
jgi:hypothetical protein